MERRCSICGSSFTNLTRIWKHGYFSKQVQALFDAIDIIRTTSFVCHRCKELVTGMYEFYMHVRKTQRILFNLPDERPQLCCRLCGCSYENLTSLFHDSILPNHIYKLFKVKVTQQDTLPTVICEPCQKIIHNNLKFYAEVNKVQEMFFNELSNDCVQIDPQQYNEISNILDNLPVLYSVQEKDDFEGSLRVNKQTIELNNENDETEMLFKHIKEENLSQGQSLENTEEFNESSVNNDSLMVDELLELIRSTSESVVNNDSLTVDDLIRSINSGSNSCSSELSKSEDIKSWKMVATYNKVILPHRQLQLLRNTNGEDIFRCICCKMEFKSTSDMFRHEREFFHKKYKAYRCGKCSRVFATKNCRASHKMLHKKIGDFKCDRCTKSFLHSEDLYVHVKAHTIEFSNTCPICELDFQTSAELKMHGNTHSTSFKSRQYPFYCAICGQGHQTREKASNHLLTHKLQKDVRSLLNQTVT